MNTNEIIGHNVRAKRVSRGVSALWVAKLLGMDPGHYCRMEAGVATWSADRLRVVCDAFGIDPKDAMTSPPAAQP